MSGPAGTYTVAGEERPVPSRHDSSGTMSDHTTGWLHAYQWGVPGEKETDVKNVLPSDDVINELSKTVGKSPMKLYRAVHVDAKDDPSKHIESWTRYHEHAQGLVNAQTDEGTNEHAGKWKIVERVVHPSEVIVDTTRLPKAYTTANDVGTQAEVITARGPLLERLKAARSPMARIAARMKK